MNKSTLLAFTSIIYITLLGVIVYNFSVIKELKSKEPTVKVVEIETCSFESLETLPLDYTFGLDTD